MAIIATTMVTTAFADDPVGREYVGPYGYTFVLDESDGLYYRLDWAWTDHGTPESYFFAKNILPTVYWVANDPSDPTDTLSEWSTWGNRTETGGATGSVYSNSTDIDGVRTTTVTTNYHSLTVTETRTRTIIINGVEDVSAPFGELTESRSFTEAVPSTYVVTTAATPKSIRDAERLARVAAVNAAINAGTDAKAKEDAILTLVYAEAAKERNIQLELDRVETANRVNDSFTYVGPETLGSDLENAADKANYFRLAQIRAGSLHTGSFATITVDKYNEVVADHAAAVDEWNQLRTVENQRIKREEWIANGRQATVADPEQLTVATYVGDYVALDTYVADHTTGYSALQIRNIEADVRDARLELINRQEESRLISEFAKDAKAVYDSSQTSDNLNILVDAIARKEQAVANYSRAWLESQKVVDILRRAQKDNEYFVIAQSNLGLIMADIHLREKVILASRTDIDDLVANSHWIKETGADTAWAEGITGDGEIITIFDGFSSETAETHGRRVAQIAGGIDEDFGTIGIAPEARIVEYSSAIGGGEEFVKAAADTNASVINISVGGYHGADMNATIAGASTATALFVIASGNDQHMDCRSSTNYSECLSVAAQFITGGNAPFLANKTIIVGNVKEFNKGQFTFNLGTNAGDLMDHYIVAEGTAAAGKAGSSFAAPRVTGTAALVMQKFPTLTAAQVKDLILGSATDIGVTGTDDVFGVGKLNLLKALSITN